MKVKQSLIQYEFNALSILISEKRYLMMLVLLSVLICTLYLFLLPSLPDGGLVFYAIYFITPLQVVFAISFGVLISLVFTLNVYAYRIKTSSRRNLTVGSILASLVNGLCCTPLIPSLIALTGVSTPVLYSISPRIQAFFEFNYGYFYALSLILLLISVHYLSRNISCCANKVT
jgi:hypothetical protein